ncbi:MAG: hypothetical protein QM730_28470 [Anaerolineales bacterium]
MKKILWLVVLVSIILSYKTAASISQVTNREQLPLYQVNATSTPSSPSDVTQPFWNWLQNGWMHFSQDGNGVWPIYDPAGYFWAIGDNGLLRWNIETGEVKVIEHASSDSIPYVGGIVMFATLNGKVWVVTTVGDVSYYSDGTWIAGQSIPYQKTTPAGALTFPNQYRISNTNNRLWASGEYIDYSKCPTSFDTFPQSCVSRYQVIYYFDGREWGTFNQMPDKYLDSAYSVAESKDGSYWFWNGYYVLRYSNQSWTEYKNLESSKIVTLSDGTLLFIFDTLILSFDGQQLSPLIFPENNYHYPIERSYLTPNGDLFVRLHNYYNKSEAQTYLIHNGEVRKSPDLSFENIPNGVSTDYPVTTPRGWILHSPDGFYLYDGKNWKKFTKPNSYPIYQAMGGSPLGFARDGSLWSIDYKGIKRFDGKTGEYVYKGSLCFPDLPPDAPLSNPEYGVSYRMDTNGNIWGISSVKNLLCYFDAVKKEASIFEVAFNIGILARFPVPFPHFKGNGFALAPNGSVWVASPEGYIANFTLDFLKKDPYRKVDMIKIGGDLVHYPLNPLRIEVGEDGAVWIFAEHSGLYRYDGKDWKYYGLSNLEEASAFAIDKQGHIWAGYPDLLLKYDGNTWTQYPIEKDFNTKSSLLL